MRAIEEARHREQTLALFREVHTTATNAAAAAERANLSSQQFMLRLQEMQRRERSPVNVIANSGGGPPPPPPPGTAPLEAVSAQPPNRMQLVPVVNEAVKRAASASAEAAVKRRPADEVAAREPRAVARLAIAAASGAAAGPESPDEVPGSSSAGPEFVKPEQLQAYSAAHRRLAIAFPRAVIPKIRRPGVQGQGGRQHLVGQPAPGPERQQADGPHAQRGSQQGSERPALQRNRTQSQLARAQDDEQAAVRAAKGMVPLAKA